MENVVIASFEAFNERRYSAPWVCKMTPDGKYNFAENVGIYTGNARKGEHGDLIVSAPVEGQVYGYGQKDHRGNNTEIKFAKWNGEEFVPCDKIGR